VSSQKNPVKQYTDFTDTVVESDLEGFLSHWDFAPPAGSLLRMLKGSSIVVLACDPATSRICGYVAALTDHVVCGYISAIEVRPECRNQGIGAELLKRVTEKLSVYGIYLSCAAAMIPFYQAAGFKQVTGMARRIPPGLT